MKQILQWDGARPRLFARNWEKNIFDVIVKPCSYDEDPTGYKAVFVSKRRALKDNAMPEHFEIGASLLSQRQSNLAKAGYKAPMTERAIHMLEIKLNHPAVLNKISA